MIQILQSIEVKFLPATDHKPTRLKAITTSGLTLTESLSHFYDSHDDQAYDLAVKAHKQLLRGDDVPHIGIVGCGRLNNGNYIFTLGDK